MLDRKRGIMHQHARPGKAHDHFDFYPHILLVAMDWTLLAEGLFFAELAAVQTLLSIVQQELAIRAQMRTRVTVSFAINNHHFGNCYFLRQNSAFAFYHRLKYPFLDEI